MAINEAQTPIDSELSEAFLAIADFLVKSIHGVNVGLEKVGT